MARFSLADWVERASAAFNVDKEKLTAEAQRIARDYPDAAARAAQLESYLQSLSTPEIVAQFAGAIQGFASDYAAGVAKVDPGAWSGAG